MKGMKKLLLMLLSIMFLLGVGEIPVLAATTSQDGLEVTMTANQKEYDKDDEITVTLSVKNTNDFTVENVSLEGIIPNGYELGKGTKAIKEIDALEAGQTLEVTVNYVPEEIMETKKDTTDTNTNKKDNTSDISSVGTGDKSNIRLWGILLVIAFCSIITILILQKKSENLLSIFLCITIIMASATCPSLEVSAAENDKNTFEIREVIQIDGKEVSLKAKVNYQAFKDDQVKQSVEFIVDDDNLTYENNNDCYFIEDDSIDSVRGKIVGKIDLLKSIEYEILDDQNIVIKKGHIKIGTTWSIDNIGLVVGKNKVSIKGYLVDGSCNNTSFIIMNASTKYVENIDIDTNDNDRDGLNNYLEDYYNTDKNNKDTDGDRLSDYIELSLIETDPNKKDSDKNGTSDDLEDKDKDGINNVSELENQTDPALSDTDNDELDDCEEIKTYRTNPVVADTDGDGANDGWEVSNGYDPLKKEKSFSIDEEISNNNFAVKVEMDVDGNSVESLSVTENNDDVFFSSDIPGYIGSAYDFSLSGKSFDSAKISFKFDKSLLNDKTFVPVIYYFNEDTQMLEELETIVEGNTASTTVNHFSTYILLNKTEFDKIWDTEIKPPEYEGDSDTVLDIAFVIDYSKSMEKNDPEQLFKTLSKEFISKLRDEKDQAAIVKFIKKATLVSGLTTDKTFLNKAIDSINYDNGYGLYSGTNGSAGIKTALDELTPSESKYKYIIFITDGEDTKVSYPYEDLITVAKENHIIIYTVGMGNASEDILKKVASETGGKYYHATGFGDADNILDLEDIFEEIESETIDYTLDSNNDGISDYFTKLMCEGKLKTGTGIELFEGESFEEVQSNDDFDNDGLKNGEESIVVVNNNKVYLKILSSPALNDTDMDGYEDFADKLPLAWNVGSRDLAVFASLAYEDGNNYISKMYKASDIKGSEEESGEKYYFLNGASLNNKKQDLGISEKWKIVDYVNTWEDIDTYFSATTFKNGNNIVIAYRGTNEPVGEWVNNIIGVGLLNYHSEEGAAKAYALKIADKYSDCDIYITGHSLGGYLAQIGAAEILQKRTVNLDSVAYFNGIGLKYNKLLFWSKNDVLDTLENYSKNHSLISYEIKGDVVSALGTHSGQVKSYYACNDSRKHHSGKHGKGTWTDILSKSAAGWLCVITGDNLAQYYDYYEAKSIMEYFWVTHETDSFFYYLKQGERGK